MYFDAPDDETRLVVHGVGKNIAISVNCLLVLALGILPTGLFNLCVLAFKSIG